MLTATPTSFFKWSYAVSDQGKHVADVTVNWVSESGTMRIGGKSYDLHRQAMLVGAFVAECDGKVIAEAEKPSAFHRRFVVQSTDGEFEVTALSPCTRRFGIYEYGKRIGEISPKHMFARKATIDLPKEVTLEVQLFTFWLAVLMWRRQQNAAAS
jgi:hypothetical protein